jgi:hypothetical protein
MLSNVTNNVIYLNDSLLKVIITLTDDRIDAVRLKANTLLILILNKQSKEWSDANLIPKLALLRESTNYIKRQNLL